MDTEFVFAEARARGATESGAKLVVEITARGVTAEREGWLKHLRDLASVHQLAADLTDDSTVERIHDAVNTALLAAIQGPNAKV